jgi:hypothetical protein
MPYNKPAHNRKIQRDEVIFPAELEIRAKAAEICFAIKLDIKVAHNLAKLYSSNPSDSRIGNLITRLRRRINRYHYEKACEKLEQSLTHPVREIREFANDALDDLWFSSIPLTKELERHLPDWCFYNFR